MMVLLTSQVYVMFSPVWVSFKKLSSFGLNPNNINHWENGNVPPTEKMKFTSGVRGAPSCPCGHYCNQP